MFYQIYVSVLLLQCLFSIVVAFTSTHNHQAKWIVHTPAAFENETFPNMGDRLRLGSNDSFITECDYLKSLNPHASRYKSIDFENLYALENFFWSIYDGVSIELGALDGSMHSSAPSQTANFVKFGWNRILIEANPVHRENMIKFSPDAFSVNAAICKDQILHYLTRGGAKSPASGIVEFMSPLFVGNFFSFLLSEGQTSEQFDASKLNWNNLTLPKDVNIVEISCLSLQRVLDRAGTSHINFFILDVEGSELEVLKSVDWRRTIFDVICIETEKAYRPEGYADQIEKFLSYRGYIRYIDKGRNSWYIHKLFKPSKRPGLP